MQKAICHIKGTSKISFGKVISTPKRDKETHDDHEKRTWKERCHLDAKGIVYIPAMMIKNTISNGAAFAPIKVKGGGQATYTKHFVSGIIVENNATLGVHIDQVEGDWLFVPSDGKKGGSKRVHKCFPFVPGPNEDGKGGWEATFEAIVLNDMITLPIFAKVLRESGKYIGLGSFRPQNGFLNGRFAVERIEWCELEKDSKGQDVWKVKEEIGFDKIQIL